MKATRVGVIGIGNMGSSHARTLAEGKVPGAELAAVCDIDNARLEWAAETWGDKVQRFSSAEELFAADSVDAVIIATPHYDHPPLTIAALQNKLHVLSEKPAGVYTAQVREMNAAAEKSESVFALMFNQRTRPAHRKLKALIDAGELGAIRRVNYIMTTWFRSEAYYRSGGWRATWAGEGGGVLLNQCPHNLDLLQWICGMPERIRAFCYFGKYHDIEVEDDVTAFLEYPNGATGVFVTTTAEAPGTNRLEIIGERGRLLFDDAKIIFDRTEESVEHFCRSTKERFTSVPSWHCEIPCDPGWGEGHLGIIKNFIAAIRDGAKLEAPGVEGIKSLSLSNAMLLSAWTDNWVTLPVDDAAFYEKLKSRIKASTYVKEVDEKAGTETDMSKSF